VHFYEESFEAFEKEKHYIFVCWSQGQVKQPFNRCREMLAFSTSVQIKWDSYEKDLSKPFFLLFILFLL